MAKREPFGAVAVKLHFVTEAGVKKALRRQREIDKSGEQHKLIGLVMLEMGLLGTTQLIEVLQYIEKGVSAHHNEEEGSPIVN